MSASGRTRWHAVVCYLGVFSVFTLVLIGGCPSGNTGGNGDANEATEPNEASDSNEATEPNEPVDANQPVTSTFQLSVTIEGQGSVDPPGGEFDANEQVAVTATALSGWRFDHWDGALTGSDNPATLTMSADLAVTAVFVASGDSALTFYAVYDWIVDDDQLSTPIDRVAMTGDGKKIFFANGEQAAGRRKGYSINPDGTGLTTYPLPDCGPYGCGSIKAVVTSETGTRTFFVPPYDKAVFKLENGAITTLSVDKVNGPGDVGELAINADGTVLVFRDSAKIWRMDHTGGGLQWIVNAADVPAIGGRAEALGTMVAAADGSTIAFILYVRSTQTGVLNTEVFCLHGGTMTQVTNDQAGTLSKGGLLISGDGQTIVYMDVAQGKYIAVAPDGSNSRAVAATGINATVSWRLTHDGGKMIYADGLTNGGRMINTDGTGTLDLFPHLYISFTGPLSISKDGSHMVFSYEYAQWPFKRALYVGHLNDADAVASAPKIHNIAFSPLTMPRGNPDATIVLTTMITDPDGPADIKSTSADELLDGVLKGSDADVPAYFYFAPVDNGAAPDVTAGDNIFSSLGKPGGKINEFDHMTIRVGAKDASNTVVLADTVLNIGP